jgi:hypothetical protein
MLANVSGFSSLNELPAAVPTDEIVEHEKGSHTVANSTCKMPKHLHNSTKNSESKNKTYRILLLQNACYQLSFFLFLLILIH